MVGGIVILFFGTRLEHRKIMDLAQRKVEHDLASAWMVYNDKLKDIEDVVSMATNEDFSRLFSTAIQPEKLQSLLKEIQTEYGLDILTLTDEKGTVVLRANNDNKNDDRSRDPVISRALQGQTVKATQIIQREELLLEGEHLADRASMTILPTPKASPRPDRIENKGMLLKAASPIKEKNGRIRGILYGGILLNRHHLIVDRVKDIVFKGEKYKDREVGTATIFQDDIRISTNVLNNRGERALGTRLSQEVYQSVFLEGQSWIDRAFVVNDWYITAYAPIRDIEDHIIGMLYVGMLEKPYLEVRDNIMAAFTVMAGIFAVVLLFILGVITTSIIKPLGNMVIATERIAAGDLSHKVHISSGDELGHLASSFNRMIDNLRTANNKLVQWGKILEKRVQDRTKELRDTQASLIQSEKMASLGKLAAGIAHEINNPLTSILIHAHLLLEQEKDAPSIESLEMIRDETTRCSSIVKGLLDFSRQNPPHMMPVNINQLLEVTIVMVQNQVSFHNIRIKTELSGNLPSLTVDKDKIKQVFLNLMINAAEATPQAGVLTIRTELTADGRFVLIKFIDTGSGIPEEFRGKLFDPFFTTKSGGTGLGLAVSYGIIKQHNGTIEVESTVGKGSSFIIRLPVIESTPQSKESQPGDTSHE